MLSFIPTYNPIANGARSMYMPQQERLHKLNQIGIQQMFNFAPIYGEYVVIGGMIGGRNAIGGA